VFSVSIVHYFHCLTFTLLWLCIDLQQSSRIQTTSHSSSIVDTVGETEVVVLQSSPLHHLYWQPVNSSTGNGSHDSSIDCGPSTNSSTNATPIQQRKQRVAEQGLSVKPPLSQAKLEPPTGTNKGSLHSLLQRTGSSRSITGSQTIGCSNGLQKPKQHQRPSSLLVLGDDLNMERATPPTSPKHNVAFRSRSADDGHNSIKPPSAGSTSIITNLTSSLRAKMSNGSLAEGTIANTSGSPSFLETPASSLEKLNRLKDRFMRTVTAPGGNISSSSGVAGVEGHADMDSDDENTPLVSEISTPAASSGLNALASEFLNRGFAAVGGYSSHSGSSEDSPSSVKTTPISPPTVVIQQQQQEQDIQEQIPAEADNGNIDALINSPFMKDDNNVASAENYVSSSCGSSVSLSQVLEPASNYYHLVAVSDSISSAESNVEDGSHCSSHEQLNDSDLRLSSNKIMLPSSSHLLRQDALDGSGATSCRGSKDQLDDWNNPETTV
jgi:hypothetical protein